MIQSAAPVRPRPVAKSREEIKFLDDIAKYQRSVANALKNQSTAIMSYLKQREGQLRRLAGSSLPIGSYVIRITEALRRGQRQPTKYQILSWDPTQNTYKL